MLCSLRLTNTNTASGGCLEDHILVRAEGWELTPTQIRISPSTRIDLIYLFLSTIHTHQHGTVTDMVIGLKQ